jgi:uncharacterized protein YndB with AHSA1/START domain
METKERTIIKVETLINASIGKVWRFWREPNHIIKWYSASDDWHTPRAENDLRKDGTFSFRMEAKDGSAGFDFEGVYTHVIEHDSIVYVLSDGRKVKTSFRQDAYKILVTQEFEAESINPLRMQQEGWQAILNNFKKVVESSIVYDKLRVEILIDAPVEKVFTTMLDEQKYREWTSVFNAGSYYKGSWEKGSKIIFIGTDENGSEGGMVARIRENLPNKYVSIEHYGLLENDKEITIGEQVEGWAGAQENYSFEEVNGKTLVSVDMDSNEEYYGYFTETWPKALEKLKSICEK